MSDSGLPWPNFSTSYEHLYIDLSLSLSLYLYPTLCFSLSLFLFVPLALDYPWFKTSKHVTYIFAFATKYYQYINTNLVLSFNVAQLHHPSPVSSKCTSRYYLTDFFFILSFTLISTYEPYFNLSMCTKTPPLSMGQVGVNKTCSVLSSLKRKHFHPNGFYWCHQYAWTLTRANSMQVFNMQADYHNRK